MSTKAPDTYERSRREIISYISSFCLTHVWPKLQPSHRGSIHGFLSDIGDEKARIGDLVALQSAPVSKWAFSWLVDTKPESGGTNYLLESTEDHAYCWWSNVSIDHLERDVVSENPQWRWSDRQYAFWDRWRRVCRDEDAYVVLPTPPVFGAATEVTIGCRTRHGFDDERPAASFPDWRKVTKPMMREFYRGVLEQREARKAAISKAAEGEG